MQRTGMALLTKLSYLLQQQQVNVALGTALRLKACVLQEDQLS